MDKTSFMQVPPLFKDLRLGVLSAGNFVIGTNMAVLSGLLGQLAEDLQVSIAKAGYLIAAFALTCVIAAPLFATLSARFERRKLLSLMLLVCALANGLAYFAQSYEQLMATRLLAAVSTAVFTPQAAAVLGLLVAPAQRRQATSAIMLGWSMAAVLGVPLGVWIGAHFGWRSSMGLIGLASLLTAGAVWIILPASLFVPRINLQSWLSVLKTPALLLLIGTSLIFAAGHHAVFSYIAPMVASVQPGHPALLSSLLLTYGVAAVVSNVLAVLLMEKIGLESMVRVWGLIPLAVMLILPLLSHQLIALYFLLFLWGMGAAGFNGLQQARLATVAPTLAAASIALNSSAFYFGQSTGTLLGGALWNEIGARHLPWLGLALITLAMLLSRKGRHAAQHHQARDLPPTNPVP